MAVHVCMHTKIILFKTSQIVGLEDAPNFNIVKTPSDTIFIPSVGKSSESKFYSRSSITCINHPKRKLEFEILVLVYLKHVSVFPL